MRIGTLAGRAGVSTATVRYYERRGLIGAPPRTGSGYRRYGDDAVKRLRFIMRARDLGFSLQEVAELLALRVTDPRSCALVEATTRARLADVERRIAELERLQEVLRQLVSACGSRKRTAECPVLEMLGEERAAGA